MLLHNQVRNVETSEFESQKQAFSFKSSAMAFKIMSDKLYSDKVQAVIREYGCNAYDAQVAAGTQDKPFLVHLPNTFEPWFSIRDYGIGLSEADIYNIYTVYFDSTKSTSNKFIGALGLGSKSAFSYTDQFTIESFINGERTIYTAYFDEDGNPNIQKISAEPSTEPNGLLIQVMVEPNDFKAFAEKSVRVFGNFNPVPTIVGADISDEMSKIKVVYETKNFKVLQDFQVMFGHRGYNQTRAYALQGIVAYSIDPSNFSENLTVAQRELLRSDIILKFDIGELDIAPNREQLSYNKLTQQNILAKLDKVTTELADLVNTRVAAAKTKYEAVSVYNQLKTNNDTAWANIASLVGIVMRSDKINWKGKIIDSAYMSIPTVVVDKSNPVVDPTTLMFIPKTRTYVNTMVCDSYELNSERCRASWALNKDKFEFNVNKVANIIVVDDVKKQKNLSAYLREYGAPLVNSGKHLLVVKCADTVTGEFVEEYWKLFHSYIKGFDEKKIHFLSTFDEPASLQKVTIDNKKVSSVVQAYRLKLSDTKCTSPSANRYDNNWAHCSLSKTEEKLNIADGGYYMVGYNNAILRRTDKDGSKFDVNKITPILRFAKTCGIITKDIEEQLYVFNYSKFPKAVAVASNWVNIIDYVEAEFKKRFDNKVALHQIQLACSVANRYEELKSLKGFSAGLADKSPLCQLENLVHEISDTAKTAYDSLGIVIYDHHYFSNHTWSDLCSTYATLQEVLCDVVVNKCVMLENIIDAKLKKHSQTVYASIDKTLAKYPALLSLLSKYRYANSDVKDKSIITHYVELCNASPRIAAQAKVMY